MSNGMEVERSPKVRIWKGHALKRMWIGDQSRPLSAVGDAGRRPGKEEPRRLRNPVGRREKAGSS